MFTLSFAMLTLASFAVVLVAGLGSLVSASVRHAWITIIGASALPLAAIVAVVTMSGSLYFSEVLHFQPCRLCWYQRAMAYPLAIILPIAILAKRPLLHRTVFPLAAIGALISSFHILIEHFPNLESSSCDPSNPCSLEWVKHFGFVTIPVMALASFMLQLLLVTTAERSRKV
jgi:disulfide bond formation protein DsbB